MHVNRAPLKLFLHYGLGEHSPSDIKCNILYKNFYKADVRKCKFCLLSAVCIVNKAKVRKCKHRGKPTFLVGSYSNTFCTESLFKRADE